MTVHMIRLYVGPNDKMTLAQAKEAWQTWVSNHTEWTEDTTEHTLTETETMDRHTYWTGDARFALDDAKANLLQKCEDKWQNKCEWYRLGHHECGKDRPDLSVEYTCEWGEKREWPDTGSIPAWVPEIVVSA